LTGRTRSEAGKKSGGILCISSGNLWVIVSNAWREETNLTE